MVNGVEIVIKQVNISRKELVVIAGAVADRGGVAVLITTFDGVGVVAASGVTDKIHAGQLVSTICVELGGKGGGKEDLAQGAGSDAAKIADAIATANDFIRAQL
jgi:alanyl-tRNA synthetase